MRRAYCHQACPFTHERTGSDPRPLLFHCARTVSELHLLHPLRLPFERKQIPQSAVNIRTSRKAREPLEATRLPGKQVRDILRGSGGCEDRTVAELVFEVAQERDGGYRGSHLTRDIFAQADSWDRPRSNLHEAVRSDFFDGTASKCVPFALCPEPGPCSATKTPPHWVPRNWRGDPPVATQKAHSF